MDKGDLSFLINEGVAQMIVSLLPIIQHLVIKCGDRGVIVAMRVPNANAGNTSWASEQSNVFRRYIIGRGEVESGDTVVLQHFPAVPIGRDEVVSVTGAGDTLVGALCAAITRDQKLFYNKEKLEAAIRVAQEAAVLSLRSIRAISPSLGDIRHSM